MKNPSINLLIWTFILLVSCSSSDNIQENNTEDNTIYTIKVKEYKTNLPLEGFITLAPDALSPLGGYPGNDDAGRELQKKRSREEMLEDFIAAYKCLKSHKDCNGHIGLVGFCFGGWIANMMAVKTPKLSAAVPYYGGQPTAEEAEKIKTSILAHYAGLDTRVNEGWPAFETILKKNKVEHTAYFYPGVNHGFHNNTTPRYDEKAATLSWKRTIDFFSEKLKKKLK